MEAVAKRNDQCAFSKLQIASQLLHIAVAIPDSNVCENTDRLQARGWRIAACRQLPLVRAHRKAVGRRQDQRHC